MVVRVKIFWSMRHSIRTCIYVFLVRYEIAWLFHNCTEDIYIYVVDIQRIDDDRREFLNEVNTELHKLTVAEQKIISVYQGQFIGLVERQKRTIKNSLVMVLRNNPCKWPYIIERILFSYHVGRHFSTPYSPFMMI